MRVTIFVSLIWAAATSLLCAQTTYQQRQDLRFEDRIETLEEHQAALGEDVRNVKSALGDDEKHLRKDKRGRRTFESR
jgi:uncharacterized protein (UPF0335 family)